MARKVSEINAGSMADIAFLLLIFFLVTTTMDVDSGLSRQLPPLPDNTPPPKYNKRNLFVVLVNKNDQLLVRGKPGDYLKKSLNMWKA
jgi:biopolymer transport protein ExbD